MSTQFNLVNRLVSAISRTPDGTLAKSRATEYGELIVQSLDSDQRAVEGSSFVATTPAYVPGTGVAFNAAAFAFTTPAFIIRNSAEIGGKNINIKRLKLVVTAAGTGTAMDCLVTVDSTNRMPASGGVDMVTTNVLTSSSQASGAIIKHSGTAMVGVPAPTATSRNIIRTKLKQAAPVVGDEFSIYFGGDFASDSALVSGTATASTAPSYYAKNVGSFVIPPQATGMIYLWGVNPSAEIFLEYIER
jgi:hypothetical protein